MNNINTEGLLIVERLVMESLSMGAKNMDQLAVDTRLSLPLVSHIIPELMSKGIVIKNSKNYQLNDKDKTWKKEVLKLKNIKSEVRELIVAMINDYFKEAESGTSSKDEKIFKMQKVFFTPDEEKIFNAHLKNLESFIEGVKKQQSKMPQNIQIHAQRIVFWGSSKYYQLVNSMLEAI